MSNISLTKENVKKYKKRLKSTLESKLGQDIPLHFSAEIFARTFGFKNEYEMLKLLPAQKEVKKTCKCIELVLKAQALGANLIGIKKTTKNVAITFYQLSALALIPNSKKILDCLYVSKEEYSTLIKDVKSLLLKNYYNEELWSSSKQEKIFGFDVEISASYVSGPECECLFINIVKPTLQPARVLLSDLQGQDDVLWGDKLNFEKGGVVICGPTYSGKSTLAHALRNTFRDKRISVVEIIDNQSAKEFIQLSKEHICMGVILSLGEKTALERFKAYGVCPQEAQAIVKHIHEQKLKRTKLTYEVLEY